MVKKRSEEAIFAALFAGNTLFYLMRREKIHDKRKSQNRRKSNL